MLPLPDYGLFTLPKHVARCIKTELPNKINVVGDNLKGTKHFCKI
jgi:hypothetical protein